MIVFYSIETSPQGYTMFAHTDTLQTFVFTFRPTFPEIMRFASMAHETWKPVIFDGQPMTFEN